MERDISQVEEDMEDLLINLLGGGSVYVYWDRECGQYGILCDQDAEDYRSSLIRDIEHEKDPEEIEKIGRKLDDLRGYMENRGILNGGDREYLEDTAESFGYFMEN